MTQPDWMQAAQAAAASQAPMPMFVIPDVVPSRTVHIDGDYLAYHCAGNDETPFGVVRKVVLDKIAAFRDMSGAARAVVHLTAADSNKGQRFHVATVKAYQGQRDHGRRPKNWLPCREFMEGYTGLDFSPVIWRDREADDGFAYASAKCRDPVQDCVIAAKDKDMRMIPGTHINWSTFVLTDTRESEFDVLGRDGLQYGTKWFWLQMLMGDTADHIPGLPKLFGKPCGEVGAGKYLAEATSDFDAFHLVMNGYADHYGSLQEGCDRFVEQASLLWMRHTEFAGLCDFMKVVPALSYMLDACVRLRERVALREQELREMMK